MTSSLVQIVSITLAMCGVVLFVVWELILRSTKRTKLSAVSTETPQVVIPPGGVLPFHIETKFGANPHGQIVINLCISIGDVSNDREICIPREISLALASRVLENQGEDGLRAAGNILANNAKVGKGMN